MPRYKLTIEYDGTPYRGWQFQPDLPTVQGALETVFLEFTREQVTLFAAGRTDAGVHAKGQVAHVDLSAEWRLEKICEAANGLLKLANHSISLLKAENVSDDFDARFSAKRRFYRYVIVNRRANLTIDALRARHAKWPLDISAMNEAAQVLVGRHDFTTFRSTDCQAKNPIRTLDSLEVRKVADLSCGGQEIEILTSSRAFLHNQVRSMAGSLKLVGEGKWQKRDMANALAALDRKACGPVAPACALYFEKVEY